MSVPECVEMTEVMAIGTQQIYIPFAYKVLGKL
jgi:hypothetical protein